MNEIPDKPSESSKCRAHGGVPWASRSCLTEIYACLCQTWPLLPTSKFNWNAFLFNGKCTNGRSPSYLDPSLFFLNIYIRFNGVI